jgi:hypothetical protein
MKTAICATALLFASHAPLCAQAPLAVREVAAPSTHTACLIDSAFGFDERTPVRCFEAAATSQGEKQFWKSFLRPVPKPTLQDVHAFYDIRSGDAIIGREETSISTDAQAAISRCWARLDRLQDTGQKIPAPVCD